MLELVDGELRVVPCHLIKEKKQHHVNLLLIQPEDTYIDVKAPRPEESDDDGRGPIPYHYVWIKNLSRLLSKQNSKHDGRMYFCERCLHGFLSQQKLEAHEVDCAQVNECRVTTPKVFEDKSGNKGHVVKFKNFSHKTKVPFESTLTSKAFSRRSTSREPVNNPKEPRKSMNRSVAPSTCSVPSTQRSPNSRHTAVRIQDHG